MSVFLLCPWEGFRHPGGRLFRAFQHFGRNLKVAHGGRVFTEGPKRGHCGSFEIASIRFTDKDQSGPSPDCTKEGIRGPSTTIAISRLRAFG